MTLGSLTKRRLPLDWLSIADAEQAGGSIGGLPIVFQLKPTKLGWLPVSIIPVVGDRVLLLVEPMSESSASSAGKD